MKFVSYQDELKKIWRDNVAATKSAVLEGETDVRGSIAACARNNHNCKGYTIIGLHKLVCICYCHTHQFITKIPVWNSNSHSIKRRNNIIGS
ncbi:MAG TPA: hypothetical protein VJ729_08510 [Nitrososphaeraceae archaeon]|nr:hypothetical protein [Nitrososphaeraceae archaeon]